MTLISFTHKHLIWQTRDPIKTHFIPIHLPTCVILPINFFSFLSFYAKKKKNVESSNLRKRARRQWDVHWVWIWLCMESGKRPWNPRNQDCHESKNEVSSSLISITTSGKWRVGLNKSLNNYFSSSIICMC